MRPRVIGVDARSELRELGLGDVVAGAVGSGHPRPFVAEPAPFGKYGDVLTRGLGAEPGNDRQPELLRQPAVGSVELADELAAELYEPSVRKPRLLNPASGAATRLQHDDVRARRGQVACRGQTGQPGPDDDDVTAH